MHCSAAMCCNLGEYWGDATSFLNLFVLQVSWQALGLSQLNAELRCPVSAAEVQAQQLAHKGQLFNDNAASLLPPFVLDMGVAAADSAPRQFWVEFTNEGVLPVNWELHSYDAPQVCCFVHSSSLHQGVGKGFTQLAHYR